MPLPLLPTSLVGSYAQPDWLIDRKKLAGRFPPRVRAKELWRVAPEYLDAGAGRRDACSRSATRSAPASTSSPTARCAARATPTASPPRSRASTSTIPGTALDRSGHPNPVPRVVGKIRRKHPVEVDDVKFLRANTTAPSRSRCRAPSRCRSRRRTTSTRTRRRWRSTTPPPSTPRSRTCSRPAPTSCRSTSPTCRRGRRRRASTGSKALNGALDGVEGHDRGAHLLRLRRRHPRAAGGLFVPAGVRGLAGAADLDRDGAVRSSTARCWRSCPARPSSSACSTSPT